MQYLMSLRVTIDFIRALSQRREDNRSLRDGRGVALAYVRRRGSFNEVSNFSRHMGS